MGVSNLAVYRLLHARREYCSTIISLNHFFKNRVFVFSLLLQNRHNIVIIVPYNLSHLQHRPVESH